MDPEVRGPRWHPLTFPEKASSHLKLVGQPLGRWDREWRWRGGTRLAHLNPTACTDRASPSTHKQRGARILRGQEKGTERYPNTGRVWELSVAECSFFPGLASCSSRHSVPTSQPLPPHHVPIPFQAPAPQVLCLLTPPEDLSCFPSLRPASLLQSPPVSHMQSLVH